LHSLTSGTDFLDNASARRFSQDQQRIGHVASAASRSVEPVDRQIRQDFNKNLINVLQTGSSNLTWPIPMRRAK